MKKLVIFLLCSFLISSCSSENITENTYTDESFSIHLLKDKSIDVVVADSIGLNKLVPDDTPLITGKDMLSYIWEIHSFILPDNCAQVAFKRLGEYRLSRGVPFIVMVNNERIYLGAYIYIVSSFAPSVPTICDAEFYSGDSSEKRFNISIPSFAMNDPRGDKRIYNALKACGVLVEAK